MSVNIQSTRRQFLGATMLSAATLTLARPALAQSAVNPIDAHVHIWTPDTKSYPIAAGWNESSMQPKSFTPDELFKESRPAGVNRIVLIQMSFYTTDNSYMLDAIKKFPDNFRGVGIIDEKQPDACQTMRRLQKEGVNGFRLYADRASVASWADSTSMAGMWNCAAETGQSMCLLANPDALPGIKTLCEKFPQTRVVIDHFARIGVDGTLSPANLDAICQLVKFPQVFVKTSAFYALGKKQPPYTDLAPMIRRLRDEFGAERLMWASDCPYQVQGIHSYADSIALIRDRLDFLTESDKSWLLQKTAEKVFWA